MTWLVTGRKLSNSAMTYSGSECMPGSCSEVADSPFEHDVAVIDQVIDSDDSHGK